MISFRKMWFGRKCHGGDSEKNFINLKVSKGISEVYSEPCQTWWIGAAYGKFI